MLHYLFSGRKKMWCLNSSAYQSLNKNAQYIIIDRDAGGLKYVLVFSVRDWAQGLPLSSALSLSNNLAQCLQFFTLLL